MEDLQVRAICLNFIINTMERSLKSFKTGMMMLLLEIVYEV